MTFEALIKKADWKNEKHVPTIDIVEKKPGLVTVKAAVGKEIPHPNTTEHHIAWIELYFLPAGASSLYQLGRYDFLAHGASTEGPNKNTLYIDPVVTISFKTDKPGTLYALSYCNIHGLWTGKTDLV